MGAVLAAVLPCLAGAPDPYPRNTSIDMLNYTFELTLSDEYDVIFGRALIDLRILTAPAPALRLDLIEQADSLDGKGMVVDDVSLGDETLPFLHENDALTITLPADAHAGDRVSIVVAYHGVPAAGLDIGPDKYGDRTFFSDDWPNLARHWLPTVDHPYDKATSSFVVTAPAHYQVVSNGLLTEETDLPGDFRRTTWVNSVPIAVWLYNLGVAEFAVQRLEPFRGKPVQTWVYRQDRDAGFYDFAVPTHHVLEFYSDFIGPFAYEKLANIESNSAGGGMEAASSIFYADGSVTGTRSVRWRNVVIHEIAHQWFGNAVTESDWDDVWLSEGFATYFTLLFIEHAYGRDEFVDGLKSARDQVHTYYTEHPDDPIVHDNLTDMGQVTSTQTYQKGAWVLHMLRDRIGMEAFQRGIRRYYRQHFNGNATTVDLKYAMEEASGENLDEYFEQWLYRGGQIELNATWSFDPHTKRVTLRVRQVQEGGDLFTFPVEVGLYEAGASEPTIHRLNMDSPSATFRIDVDKRPVRLEIDPRTVLLAEWTVSEESR